MSRLRVSPLVVVAGWIGWRAARDVADVRFVAVPAMLEDPLELAAWLQTHDPMAFTTTHPSTGWVIAAALVYALSIIAHELGHYAPARAFDGAGGEPAPGASAGRWAAADGGAEQGWRAAPRLAHAAVG